jgi:hypothetical protein
VDGSSRGSISVSDGLLSQYWKTNTNEVVLKECFSRKEKKIIFINEIYKNNW